MRRSRFTSSWRENATAGWQVSQSNAMRIKQFNSHGGDTMEVVDTTGTPTKRQTGASSNGSPAARTSSFEDISLTLIDESKHNPRQHYDEAALKELAESIRKVGVLTPCLVRPKDNGHVELAAGHRRYRASKMVGLVTMPCIVRPMSDEEFMAVLTIENLQREDVHPLDEAKGYEALVSPPYRWKVETIAGKVGKSTRYVYDALNLVKLGKPAQELFWAGKIEKSHAVLLTRLTPADQDRCINAQDGLFRAEQTLYHTEEERKDTSTFAGHVACSVRELQDWIARHVRFEPTKADPVLYAETVQAVAAAAADKRKIIPITHEYLAHEDVRHGGDRVYGERAWKRADGKEKSTPCQYAVLGVIASGEEYGEAFNVCTRKDKCQVHWGAEIKARQKNEKARASGDPTERQKAQQKEQARQEREKVEQLREEQQRETWKKAVPDLIKAIEARVRQMPTKAGGFLATVIMDEANRRNYGDRRMKPMNLSRTDADAVVRQAAFLLLQSEALSTWNGPREFPKRAKALGIDLDKILKAHAPTPAAPEKVQTSAHEAEDEEVRRENRRGNAKGRAIEKRRAKKGQAA